MEIFWRKNTYIILTSSNIRFSCQDHKRYDKKIHIVNFYFQSSKRSKIIVFYSETWFWIDVFSKFRASDELQPIDYTYLYILTISTLWIIKNDVLNIVRKKISVNRINFQQGVVFMQDKRCTRMLLFVCLFFSITSHSWVNHFRLRGMGSVVISRIHDFSRTLD